MKAYPLNITFSHQGREETIHPVLMENETELVLIDCGYPGFKPLLEETLQQIGYSLSDLTGILITHHDIDHVGALAEIKEQFPHLTVYASETEASFINGSQKPARLQQAEDLQDSLPEEQKPGGLAFQQFLKTVQPVAVDVVLPETEKTLLFSDVLIIPTPGHTPGHISVYVPSSKTLIAADALVVENEELALANPEFTLDLPAALISVQKLATFDIEHLICFHGGYLAGNLPERIQQIGKKYSFAENSQ
ncbi:MBL fold metallo-hydrolase [Rufibacter roseus]|uniref:MBL fold metallo-hydrolase n=1 Tax=Rufibacter roseus TaxID=1567108 RepID=A0ABW2DKM6_9BACT|nr:MBL fold metallo-hydrolase [Rufibacter roseus]